MPGTVLNETYILSFLNLLGNPWNRDEYSPHFTDEESEAESR